MARSRRATACYYRHGKVLAVASIFHDLDNLREELAMEHAVSRGGHTSGA